jgi:hypothetical protein
MACGNDADFSAADGFCRDAHNDIRREAQRQTRPRRRSKLHVAALEQATGTGTGRGCYQSALHEPQCACLCATVGTPASACVTVGPAGVCESLRTVCSLPRDWQARAGAVCVTVTARVPARAASRHRHTGRAQNPSPRWDGDGEASPSPANRGRPGGLGRRSVSVPQAGQLELEIGDASGASRPAGRWAPAHIQLQSGLSAGLGRHILRHAIPPL